MGIHPSIAEIIVREHKFRPITGDVLVIARQTMYFSPEEAIRMLERLQVSPAISDPGQLEIDLETRSGAPIGTFIRDGEFFRLLGVKNIHWLDHSAYEGADIIHDLNTPVPDELLGCCDFILDGSTIDNVFDLARAIKNLAQMLRPGGRLIAVNMASNHATPYVLPSPFWYADYFLANGWQDFQLYVSVYDDAGNVTACRADLAFIVDPSSGVVNPTYVDVAAVAIFAEKGRFSSWNAIPSQHHYRSEAEAAALDRNLRPVLFSLRPPLMRSRGTQTYAVPAGFTYVPPE
jgi:SAM-dependent methyltransferase